MKLLLYHILLFATFSVAGQKNLAQFLLSPFKEKKTITYGLNNRRTLLLQDQSTIYGGYIGVKFGDRLKHVFTLNSTLFWVGEGDYVPNVTELQLNYLGFAGEYLFWQKEKWAFSSYMHGGAGKIRTVSNVLSNQTNKDWVFPLEAGLHAGYLPNNWLELRFGGGYRYVLSSGNVPLNGFYYKVGAGVNLRHLKSAYSKMCKQLKGFRYPIL